jgi:hypothetical protein
MYGIVFDAGCSFCAEHAFGNRIAKFGLVKKMLAKEFFLNPFFCGSNMFNTVGHPVRSTGKILRQVQCAMQKLHRDVRSKRSGYQKLRRSKSRRDRRALDRYSWQRPSSFLNSIVVLFRAMLHTVIYYYNGLQEGGQK